MIGEIILRRPAHNKNMDDRLEEQHDFRKTIEAAAELGIDPHEQHAKERLEDDIAYEMLAVNSAMGMFGMEETAADLMQLELARELAYKQRLVNDGRTNISDELSYDTQNSNGEQNTD